MPNYNPQPHLRPMNDPSRFPCYAEKSLFGFSLDDNIIVRPIISSLLNMEVPCLWTSTISVKLTFKRLPKPPILFLDIGWMTMG